VLAHRGKAGRRIHKTVGETVRRWDKCRSPRFKGKHSVINDPRTSIEDQVTILNRCEPEEKIPIIHGYNLPFLFRKPL